MKLLMCALTFLAMPFLALAGPKKPISVRIDFLEALAPRDTTSSEQFRWQFEKTISLGIKLTAESMKKCGYTFDHHTSFYSASDTLQAMEKASEATNAGAWLIVGPRRSDHYMLMAKGSPTTPSVSLMAGASDIESLGPLHLSIYATNEKLAPSLVNSARKSLRPNQKPTYLTVLSEDCLVCKDFSALFDAAASKDKLQKLDEVKIVSETPDTAPVVEAVARKKPTFVLLPNFSKVSALIMASIQNKFPSTIFLGSDGWGDGQFGFVDRNPSLTTASGITVRGFPPVETGLSRFPLGRMALKGKQREEFIPQSGPGMAILRIIQGTQDFLCKERPQSRESFREAFEKTGRSYFSAPWGVSVYRLSNARITYWKEGDTDSLKKRPQ